MSQTFRWPLLYAAVALTASSVLLLELSLTRIFSVVFYYHFAFLAISIAMFGLGAGGVLSYWVALAPGRLFAKLGWLSAASGVLVVAALWTVLRRPETGGLGLVYFAAALPFVASGAVLSLALAEAVSRIDRVYCWDLVGASAGCLLLVPLVNLLGAPGALLGVAAVFSAASLLWFSLAGSRAGVVVGLAAVLGWSALLAYNHQHRLLDVTWAKGAELRDEIFVRWNSFSRIAVRLEKGWGAPAIFIDADANTAIASEDVTAFSPEHRRHIVRAQASSLPYVLRPGAKTLIIGPGGGVDVTHALASGSRDVTGVEINPIIVNDVMRGRFAETSRRLYSRPEVRIFVEDGRSFVRRSGETYQVLQATLVDTWASTAAGAFALTENNLYTVEAFLDYLNRLTPDGVMSFTRWGFEPPRESLRLVSLAIGALEQLGEPDPERHFVVLREGSREDLEGLGARDTVLVSRKPLPQADLALVDALAAERGFDAVYLPGQPATSSFHQLLRSPDRAAWFRSYDFDVSPVTDNRPFFFYTVQPRDVWSFLSQTSPAVDYKINRAVPLLFQLSAVSLLATVLVLLLPPLIPGVRVPTRLPVMVGLLYFAAIGAGFILIEVALIQRFVLFLGHPTYALTVVIFALLLASGLGSYYSRRRALPPALVAAATVPLALALPWLLDAGAGWPIPVKLASTAAVIAPLGFLMGMPFPAGLRRLKSWAPNAVRWAWSLNAAASVLGSAAAIMSALYLGLRETMLVGALLYLAAHALARYSPPASA